MHWKQEATVPMTPISIPEPVIEAVRNAQHIVVLTGAGISAESGIPTFREAQTGLWAQYRPEELATPEAFQRHPERVWKWYEWRRSLVRQAAPNPGHLALVQMERLAPRFTLITQNVDGLHQAAGNRHVLELHGNIMRSRCWREGRIVAPAPDDTHIPPRCPHCGAFLRPDVVWFGETLPPDVLAAAEQATNEADVFFSVGTSTVVYPAAALPFEARSHGAFVIEVNPATTPLTPHASAVLRGPAGQVLPALVQAVWNEARA